jgi:hypothetical protein
LYDDGMVYVHILAAEQKIGRPLTTNEVVHHIDEKKTNNKLTNLMVFASNHDHVLYHHCLKDNLNYALISMNNVFKCICLDDVHNTKNSCPICGKLKSKKAKYCVTCHHLLDIGRKPSKTVLKQCLKQRNFSIIGKQFGVSDNAVRKWCKSYGLPFSTIELKQLSDVDIDNL